GGRCAEWIGSCGFAPVAAAADFGMEPSRRVSPVHQHDGRDCHDRTSPRARIALAVRSLRPSGDGYLRRRAGRSAGCSTDTVGEPRRAQSIRHARRPRIRGARPALRGPGGRGAVQPHPVEDDQGRRAAISRRAADVITRVLPRAVSARRWLLVAVSFAATLGISGYILWSGWAKSGAPPAIPLAAHALALAAVFAEILTRTIKIHWSCAALRIPLRFNTALRVCLGGDFGASITPSRTGAEPARFLVLAEAGVSPASTLLILFTELFLEMTSLCLLCAILAVAFNGSGQVVSLMTAMIGGYAAIAAVGHRGAQTRPHCPDGGSLLRLDAARVASSRSAPDHRARDEPVAAPR